MVGACKKLIPILPNPHGYKAPTGKAAIMAIPTRLPGESLTCFLEKGERPIDISIIHLPVEDFGGLDVDRNINEIPITL